MKKQGALALLLGASKGKEDGANDDRKDAARDILDAIKDDDADALALALERFNGCSGDDTSEDED